MGVIIVERHVFFLEAKQHPVHYKDEYREPTYQTHLKVRSVRLPWGGSAGTLGYMDDAQFGGVTGKFRGGNFGFVRDFFLGKGHTHPKLIVATVNSASDLKTRPEVSRIFIDEFKRTQRGKRSIPVQEASYESMLAKYRQSKNPRGVSGSREAVLPAGADSHYRPNMARAAVNEVWMLFDPTQTGRKTISRDRLVRLSKTVLPSYTGTTQALHRGERGGHKKYDLDNVVILGVAYMLRYYTGGYTPPDMRWVASVQRRVGQYMAQAVGKRRRTVGAQEWYVLGITDAPVFSRRMQKSPQTGKIRSYKTFEPGRGLVPLGVRQKKQLKPLFVVKAANAAAAQEAAEKYIDRLIADPARNEHGTDLDNKFMAGGRRVLSRQAWELYR